ncbi:MAG: hypothetical protein LQ343_004048 [Gyalolechia ehrenbergii]|nr:MAG: hypothetical protein LQ343_004048 [Gyalolechia ehrenbergii]
MSRLSAKEAIGRLYDRQQAFATSKPTSTILLGDGSSFLYRQGLLAYTKGRLLRILNVHEASPTESVMLSNLVGPQIFGAKCKDAKIELCNLQDELLSVIFHGDTVPVGWRSWLLVIDVLQDESEQERVRLTVDLWTREDVIVRNNRRFLCATSSTGVSVTGRHREWVCKVWDLEHPAARPTTLQIPGLAVGEIGKGLVFEVFDGFLYAISTQVPYELDEPEWLSFYTCFRFPLKCPESTTLKSLRIWRRHHKEGPINDLWTDLKMHKDETTGELFVMEARKEWTRDSSVQKRTWYRQTLPSRFPPPEGAFKDDDEEMVHIVGITHQGVTANQSLTSSSISDQDPPYLFAMPPNDNELDHDRFNKVLGREHWPGHPRLPHNTHPEYPVDAPAPPIVDSFMLAKSKYRSYNPSAAAFIDLVVDDRQPATQSEWVQQIRFRIGSRREASPLDQNGMIHKQCLDGQNGKPVPDSERRYIDEGIRLWPPADAPAVLQDFLNGNTVPSGMSSNRTRCKAHGDITAISDERSIVYLVKEKSATEMDNGRLILINFDEHIQFFHDQWVPEYLDLYDRQASGENDKPAEEIIMAGMLKETYEPLAVDGEDTEEQDSGGTDPMGKPSDNSDNEGGVMTADNVNKYFRCEENDEDEPVDLDWFSEEMALWTNVQEGFCFV